MTMNENSIFEKAVEIFYKTGSEQEYTKFVYEACGNNMFCFKVNHPNNLEVHLNDFELYHQA